MTRITSPIPPYIINQVPKPVGKNETVKSGDEDVMKDTMPLIISKCKRTLHHTRKLAEFLKGESQNETLRNDANIILRHIRYVPDKKGYEQIRSPRRLLHEGKGDCDCFVVTLSSLLNNQKIPHFLRVIKQHDNAWTHIYVIVPKPGKTDMNVRSNYTVLDCVTDRFDHEPTFSQKKDFNMALQYLDGINENGGMSTLGQTSEYCKAQAAEAGATIRYVDTMEIKEQGLIPAKEFLIENEIPFQVKVNEKGIESYLVSTSQGPVSVPSIITPAESQALLASPTQAIQTVQASSEIKPIPEAIKTLGWLALLGTVVALVLPSNKKPAVPTPKLSGVKHQARTKKKNAIKTFTI